MHGNATGVLGIHEKAWIPSYVDRAGISQNPQSVSTRRSYQGTATTTPRTIGRFCMYLFTAAAILAVAACDSVPVASSADLGVTAGGLQDIASARAIIEDGGIPDPRSISVEGFLSEHSIPIDEPESPTLLYATATAAWHHDFDAFTPLATVQIGFGTSVDRESFERDPLNLCLVIDKSGSMADYVDQRSRTTKLDAVKIAIDRLLAHLNADDLVSVVTFTTEAKTWLDGAAGHDVAAVKSALDQINAKGGTNLATGLRRGFRVAKGHVEDSRSDRVIVFTDALLTSANESRVRDFLSVMALYSDQGIGATIFGIGTDFGHDVARDISQIRGGNFFFLNDYDRIVSVFDHEFDFLVTPVAYDVLVEADIPFSYDVVDVYGIPDAGPLTHTLELSIPTLFLSNRQGGGTILARLRAGALVDFDEPSKLAEIRVTYTRTDGIIVKTAAVEASLPAAVDPDALESYFESDATRRASLLLNTALVLKATCEDAYAVYSPYWYDYSPYNGQRAVDRLTDFLPYFDEQAALLEDRADSTSRSLSQERDILQKLLGNLQDPYG